MTLFKVDDGMWGHPKFDSVSDSAVALWSRAGSWCCRYLTDGFVPVASLQLLRGKESVGDELVAAGLWHRVREGSRDGFQFHDWADLQDLKEEVESRRRKQRTEKRVQRSKVPKTSLANPGLSATDTPTLSAGESAAESRIGMERRSLSSLSESEIEVPRVGAFADNDQVSFATKVVGRFRNLHLTAFSIDPNMGGKQVHAFPGQLAATARAQGVKAGELLDRTFKLWASRPRDKIARSSPYAAFCARFGELVGETVVGADSSGEDRLLEEIRTARKSERFDDAEKLDLQWARQYGRNNHENA